MKTERIQNPRFLGALGFLGFLGCLGSQNPAITRWAWLSLLSLLSLLVLLPTQDASTATFTLNPKKKWMLILLGFLGFLGFLASESPQLSGVACLSILSQLAAAGAKATTPNHEKKMKRGLIFAFVIFFVFVTLPLIHPWLGVLIPLLVLPSLLPFVPVLEGKDRFPLRDLIPIFMLLFAAIILPTGGIMWFMNQAMRNERMAVRQRLSELYQAQLNAAANQINTYISERKERLELYPDLPPAERFDALVREHISDGILILCECGHRKVVYPSDAVSDVSFESDPSALELQEKVRRLLREGLFEKAAVELERMASSPELQHTRDGSGRLFLPALQLFFVQTASETEADTMLDSLRNTVLDYGVEMPSSRRIFYLQSLAQHGADVEPWLGAELLAADIKEDFAKTLLLKREPSVGIEMLTVDDKSVSLMENADSSAMAIMNWPQFISEMQELINSSITMPDIRILIEKRGEQREGNPRLVGSSFDQDRVLNLYTDGEDHFAERARHRKLVHLGLGVSMVAVMSAICGLLVRSLLAQQRLTRMKNDFVATVTHELKTPLASTRMLVDTLLEGRCKSETQQREYLELIARENKRLSRLIDNFLTFSRMERNKRTFNFEDVAPGDIAKAAVETVHENYEQCGCNLSVELADKLPIIVADRDSMVQVLLNLLDNACKYSNGEKQIALSVYENGGAVCFAVKDNGIGMAKRELSKIMERFYQVDQSMTRKVGGAGLGLSIVSFIVDAHGGTIDTQSELGKGSVFTVNIPLNGGS